MNGSLNLPAQSDSLQLVSVPWMDLVDMNAEEPASPLDFDTPMLKSNEASTGLQLVGIFTLLVTRSLTQTPS